MERVIKNFAKDLLAQIFQVPGNFKPTKHFYEKTQINAHQWGKIYRGQRAASDYEKGAILNYFNADMKYLVSFKQTDLFKKTHEKLTIDFY